MTALEERASDLVAAATGHRGLPQLLARGANSRVYAVGEDLVVKHYDPTPPGRRDRMETEWEALGFLAEAGVPGVPRPVARDAEARLAVFSRLPGRHLEAVDEAAVRAAARFLRRLQEAARTSARAGRLPAASDAGFSKAQHLAVVRARFEALAGVPEPGLRDLLDGEAARLLEALAPDLEDPEVLGPEERILSPSDFGFHNALRGGDGVLRFVDFEYFGWDDPAKTVADFFHQPAVPTPPELFGVFLEELAPLPATLERARLLYPLQGLKWALLLLNPYLRPSGQEVRTGRLEKARRKIQRTWEERAAGPPF